MTSNRAEANHKYYLRHKDASVAKTKKYEQEHPEKRREYNRRYVETHKEQEAARKAEWYRRRTDMTIKDFYEANLLRTTSVVYKGQDCVCNGVLVRHYGTLIAKVEGGVLELYEVGYSTSTTKRHGILKQIAEERGWEVQE